MRVVGALDSVVRDLRYALRGLARAPAFTFAAVLTLALGIGATTAIFSVVYGVLLKPLPYPDADRLVSVRHTNTGLNSALVGIADSMFVTYAQENRVFEQLGGWGENTLALTGAGEPEQIRSVGVSDGVLQALGVQPVLGRWFSPDEYASGAGANLVILSYGLWQRRFGGDPSVLGRTLSLNSEPAEVVGVMPKGFRFLSSTFDVILPSRRDAARPLTLGRRASRGSSRA
jgi:hypothetical protein